MARNPRKNRKSNSYWNRRKQPSAGQAARMFESLEARKMLSAVSPVDDISMLNDEFDNAATIVEWQRINEVEGWNADQLDIHDIDTTQEGRMVVAPGTTVWFENYRGPLIFKEVTGDFVFSTQVHITDRDDIGNADDDDIPGDSLYSLAGLMVRTPRDITDPSVDWQPGSMMDDGTNNGENYVFLSAGYGNTGFGNDPAFQLEVKTTRNSNSQLELTNINSNVIELQLARVGDSIFALYRQPGEDWVVHRRYTRTDMPETVQLGMVSYTDWNKASDFDPFFQASNYLGDSIAPDPTPFEDYNPDILAGYEYARFSRPDLPDELIGVDLVNTATQEQLLSFLGEGPASLPGEIPAGPEWMTVEEQNVSHAQDSFNIALPDTLASGHDATYEVAMADQQLIDLQNEHGFYADASYHTNHHGGNEKWIRNSTHDWHYLLEDGTLNRWISSFEDSELIAQLDTAVYDDPTLLLNPTLPASVQIVGDQLMVDPADGYVGSFDLQLTTIADGQEHQQTVTVNVTNAVPQIDEIADAVVHSGAGGYVVSLGGSDSDGDAISWSAEVVHSQLAELQMQYNFEEHGQYYDNWAGGNERWLPSSEGWFYLLEDGTLNRWEGSFESSELIAELDPSVYNDPTLLLHAEPTPASVQVVGDELTVTHEDGFLGDIIVHVFADDGYEQTHRQFIVSVTNTAPELILADQQQVIDQSSPIVFDVAGFDADGDSLSFSASVLGSDLYNTQQTYNFVDHSGGSYYLNHHGGNEKWLQADTGEWFFLLSDNTLNRWVSSFEDSEQIAQFDNGVYDDPTLLLDSEPSPVTASVVGDQIVINRPEGYTGSVRLSVIVFDGVHTRQTFFDLEILDHDGDATTDLLAILAGDYDLVQVA